MYPLLVSAGVSALSDLFASQTATASNSVPFNVPDSGAGSSTVSADAVGGVQSTLEGALVDLQAQASGQASAKGHGGQSHAACAAYAHTQGALAA